MASHEELMITKKIYILLLPDYLSVVVEQIHSKFIDEICSFKRSLADDLSTSVEVPWCFYKLEEQKLFSFRSVVKTVS